MAHFTSAFLPTLTLLLLASLGCHGYPVHDESSCLKLDTAFRYNSVLYLVSGQTYYSIGDDMKETGTGMLSNLFPDVPDHVEAAAEWAGDDYLYLFDGESYYYYSPFFSETYGPYSNDAWTPFFEQGIDAFVRVGDKKNYFFKGCQYIEYDDQTEVYSEPKQVTDLGLPCDIDAAWDQGDFLVVVKGSNSWTLTEEGEVRGPTAIAEDVSLRSTSFCDAEPPRSELELMYEEDNSCVIIDSALNYDGSVYLFDKKFNVKIDATGSEAKIEHNNNWGGVGRDVEAALYVPNKGKVFFFKGSEYYSYYGLALGPFSATSAWDPFFAGGIDAAGIRQGKAYFFQGCHVATYDMEESRVTEIVEVEDLGLPCDISAAYSQDDALYVIKRDQVWIWGEEVTGPQPLADHVSLTSWTLCSSEE